MNICFFVSLGMLAGTLRHGAEILIWKKGKDHIPDLAPYVTAVLTNKIYTSFLPLLALSLLGIYLSIRDSGGRHKFVTAVKSRQFFSGEPLTPSLIFVILTYAFVVLYG